MTEIIRECCGAIYPEHLSSVIYWHEKKIEELNKWINEQEENQA